MVSDLSPPKCITLIDGLPGIPRGRITEVIGDASTPFAAVLAGKAKGATMWVLPLHSPDIPYAHGLLPFVDPTDICFVWVTNRREALWSTEESLRSGACTSVITELNTPPSFQEGRRLQLAAQDGGTIGLLLLPPHRQTTPASMRWECHSRISPSFDSTWWEWRVTKNKIGTIGSGAIQYGGMGWSDKGWDVVWERKTGRLSLAEQLGCEPRAAPM